jgi:hypothetical protein
MSSLACIVVYVQCNEFSRATPSCWLKKMVPYAPKPVILAAADCSPSANIWPPRACVLSCRPLCAGEVLANASAGLCMLLEGRSAQRTMQMLSLDYLVADMFINVRQWHSTINGA